MLALSPLGRLENDVDVVVDVNMLLEDPNMDDIIYGEFSHRNYDLLDGIDFDDIFIGNDVQPDLEMVEPPADLLVPELSASAVNNNNHSGSASNEDDSGDGNDGLTTVSNSSSGRSSGGSAIRKKGNKRRKSSSTNWSKDSPPQEGKRKVKVDWTPELHKRFVEAVEKLGVDKAVPSRILEAMGTCSLTRHNIASHLQKYRSHRKHLLAREAEAASWNLRSRMYTAPHLVSTRHAAALAPWVAVPAMGFPSVAPPQHHYRPLHVWGHPTMNRPTIRPWPNPNHVPNTPPSQVAWGATPLPPPPLNPSYWAHPQHHQATVVATLPAQFFPQPTSESTSGFVPPPQVPGIPPPTMFEADQRAGAAPPPPEFHPSKETIDAAIGEVLTNRVLPLPLGLKPPSMEAVIGELQRQGLTKIPPPFSSSCRQSSILGYNNNNNHVING